MSLNLKKIFTRNKVSRITGLWPLVCALILSACSSSPSSENKASEDLRKKTSDLSASTDISIETRAQDLKDELEIGRAMAAKLAGHMGVDGKHPFAVQYLNLVAASLARFTGRPEIEYTVAILENDEPNAFATPGGFVFVTSGMLRELQDEHELAGVLAHELAHISEKHLFNDLRPKRSVGAGETITRMMSRGGSDIGYGLSKMVNQGLSVLLETGLGQEKEGAADQVGILFAQSSGYNPKSLYNFLKRIGQAQARLKLGKTHPPFDERLASLNAFLTSQGLASTKTKTNDAALAKRFQKALAPFKGKAQGKT